MITLIRKLFPPILSLIFLILGSGLFNTFVPMRLALEGVAGETIGMVTSFFYAGYLVGAVRAPSWILQINHLRSLALLSLLCILCIFIQSLWIDPRFWAAIRFGNGIAMGGLFVVIESWLLLSSPPAIRNQVFSFYFIVLYSALALAQLSFRLIDLTSSSPFYIACLFIVLAMLPILLRFIPLPPPAEQPEKLPFLSILRTCPRGLFGGLISGIVFSSVYGLAPVYGKLMGFSIPTVGVFMAMIIFGGLSLQFPLGRLADRKGRRKILVTSCVITAFFSGMIGLCSASSWPFLLISCWFFGGFSFVIYPLSLAFSCENFSSKQIVSATGGFILAYGLGAIIGPLCAPLFMGWFGSCGLFYFISGIATLLAVIGAFPDWTYQKEDNP